MENTVNLFKALSDETRLRILSLLLTEGELCVCDIIAALNLPQSTISRHLAYLKKTGWVDDRRCGLWIYYSVKNKRDAFHGELADLLKRALATLPAAAADRKLLANFGRNNTCA
jgi:ArsR family transcriptional regulator